MRSSLEFVILSELRSVVSNSSHIGPFSESVAFGQLVVHSTLRIYWSVENQAHRSEGNGGHTRRRMAVRVAMAKLTTSPERPADRFKHWLLEGRIVEVAGPEAKEGQPDQHSWWQVV